MANTELITCDVKDCGKPFAYRNHGINLCATHCFDKPIDYAEIRQILKKISAHLPSAAAS